VVDLPDPQRPCLRDLPLPWRTGPHPPPDPDTDANRNSHADGHADPHALPDSQCYPPPQRHPAANADRNAHARASIANCYRHPCEQSRDLPHNICACTTVILPAVSLCRCE
jgi:hypothetical protein